MSVDLTHESARTIVKAEMLIYGNNWCASKTGAEIMDIHRELPDTLSRQEPVVLDMEEAGDSVIDVGGISSMTRIPHSSDVENACRIMAGRDDCAVRFNHDLTMKADAVRSLAQVHRTKDFATALVVMRT
jgi:hypothetical protein